MRYLLALLAVSVCSGADVHLRGRVVDPSSTPIAGAVVRVLDGAGRISTGLDGRFDALVRQTKVELQIDAAGFMAVFRSLRLNGESIADIDCGDIVMQLEPVRSHATVTDDGGYLTESIQSTKSAALTRDTPQSITVVNASQIRDQNLTGIADVVRYVPGITAIQGENNRDQLVIRGNSTSADFFLNGVRDDVQYYRDLYNLERVEALKGPNALLFGRGGAGGAINRVTKEAGPTALRELSLQGGSFGGRRFTGDFDQPLTERMALRLNGLYEASESFRRYVDLERYGIQPSVSFQLSSRTRMTASFENFHDFRLADRGLPSYGGRPVDLPISTFFGNPDLSRVRAAVNLGWISVEHQLNSRLNLRNRTLIGDYDRFYSNFVPGAVSVDGKTAALSAYNNATHRRNVFTQTDLTGSLRSGRVLHSVLAGGEFGVQQSENLRNTGYFNNAMASITVPLPSPAIQTPVTFRPGPSDANNRVQVRVASAYVQDQIQLTRRVQVVAGLRVDEFQLRYWNLRNGDRLARPDTLLSPRFGVIYKPLPGVSLYASRGVSYLPSAGDQFSSLTAVTQQVKPEKFENVEAGVKWDVRRALALTAAVYRLDRTNTRSTDPNDPTRIVQTGSQRSNGFEAGVSGAILRRWRIAGGYSYQDVFINSATAAARAGARVGQSPHHTFSLWNHLQVKQRLALGLGLVSRSAMFAAIDNTVVLPGYVRVDGALFYSLTERIRFQANVENLANRRYFSNADNNNNLSPGSPRAGRLGLTVRF